MTARAGERVLGLPLDRLFAMYMLAAAPALAFAGRPSTWMLLLALHAAVVLIAWPPRALERALSGAAPRLRRIVRGALDWAPLLLMPLLYTELAVLNRSVHGGSYFDGLVIAWEQALRYFKRTGLPEWAIPEEVAEAEQLVVGTEHEGVVAPDPGEVVGDLENVLVEGVVGRERLG